MRRIKQPDWRSLLAGSVGGWEDEQTLIVAEHLLGNNREEIARADGKASSLAVGALAIAALAGASTSTHVATASLPARWLVCIGVATWAAAVVMLAVAVFPRIGTSHNTSASTYFGDAGRVSDLRRLRKHIKKAANDRLSWLLVQVSDTSKIVVTKYRYIRIALCLLALGGGLTGVGLAM